MVICLERGADLHIAQLIPLPLTVSCSSKIQIGFTFLVPAHLGGPGQRAVKRMCVCVCVRACVCVCVCIVVLLLLIDIVCSLTAIGDGVDLGVVEEVVEVSEVASSATLIRRRPTRSGVATACIS